ncbi:MAG TPA: ATP-binding protein, partial [Candidatus Saccharimonadales bacterium]|nr:ATP-binding protein [Candidatus Saccharimonadales bacterium]
PWLPGYFGQVSFDSAGYHFSPGPLSIALQLYALIYTTATIAYLFAKINRVEREYKNQIRFMVYGIVVAFIANLLVNFTFLRLGLDRYSVIVGVPSFLLMSLAIGYAMIKHHLFDIRPLAARSLAYSMLLVTLGSLYGAAIFGVSRLFFSGNQINSYQQLTYTVLAILLAFTFQPLRRFFEHLTNNIFFRDRYVTEEVLNELGEVILSEIILTKLLKSTLTQLCHRLRITSGHFIILHEGRIYNLADFGPPLRTNLTMEMVRTLGQPIVSADQIENGHGRQLLRQLNARLSVLLRTKGQFVGFLMLGDKLSGEIYSDQDIELLKILSSQLAVAISNAIAYEQVSSFNETLKDRITSATARLRVANHHLKELDQAKDEFISMASHQLRTPLTTIKGYISMMLEGDAEPLQTRQRKFAEMAFESTQRMVYVIADLLNVSRLNAGRFILNPEPTDLAQLVRDETRLLANHAESKGVKLVVLAPKNLPKLDVDAGKIRQVIINFVDNAIYYTERGSVTVTLARAGSAVRLSVMDTGIGVPDNAKDHLFGKFYRAENARNLRPDGTGLGLYLAKKIIQAEGGRILFESTEGQGSLFGFEIPLGKTEPVETHHLSRKSPPVAKP